MARDHVARAHGKREARAVTTTMSDTPFQLKRGRLEEQLATHAARLARKNQALEDFVALVAHDVRSSLVAALKCDEPRDGLARSLDLVDSILDAVRAEPAHGESGSVAASARQAIDDLGLASANLVVSPDSRFPLPSDALRVALRNLFANAIAAGATSIHVATHVGEYSQTLVVDDDGCGPKSSASYTAGAGLGLWLCRRLLGRFDASLELTSGPMGGARALIVAR
jgi:signal transduction histidine kinase